VEAGRTPPEATGFPRTAHTAYLYVPAVRGPVPTAVTDGAEVTGDRGLGIEKLYPVREGSVEKTKSSPLTHHGQARGGEAFTVRMVSVPLAIQLDTKRLPYSEVVAWVRAE